MWKHPKYYKELRKLRNKLQAGEDSTANSTRGRVTEPEATSSQASSDKHQAPSRKRQASSRKLQADES